MKKLRQHTFRQSRLRAIYVLLFYCPLHPICASYHQFIRYRIKG